MLHRVGVIIDNGDTYRVVSVTYSDMVVVNPGIEFHKLSATAAEEIAEALSEGSEVLIPKDLDGEVLPADVTINAGSPEVLKKNQIINEATCEFDRTLSSLNMITMFEVITLSNKMLAAGIVVTDDNVDVKRTEVVAMDDADLLALFDKYVEAYNAVNAVYTKYEKLVALKNDLEEAVDEDAMDALYTAYKA